MVDQSGGPAACWPWKGKVEKSGYARTLVGSGEDRQHWLCHRLAWMIANGPIPDGLDVCHKCDNRRCCNPACFFLGTQRDNMQDAVSKRRHAYGERNGGGGVLTPDAVRLIRFFRGIHTQQELADATGVTQSIVSKVQRREIWALVA